MVTRSGAARVLAALMGWALQAGCSSEGATPVDGGSPPDAPVDVGTPRDVPIDRGSSPVMDVPRDVPQAVDLGVDAGPRDVGGDRPTLAACMGSACATITAGDHHTCVLSGDLRCGGRNDRGQLGDGTTVDRAQFVVVPALSMAAGVGAGRAHTCGVGADRLVRCWGGNDLGQLGRGPGAMAATPMPPVPGVSDVARLAVGGDHACALARVGDLWCWGDNASGQLGIGNTAGTTAPALVRVTGVVGVSAGGRHTCAWTAGGAVVCWGANGSGQLGDGGTNPRATPMPPVPGIVDITEVAAGGRHTCALSRGGTVRCWGDNASGQLGDGTVNRSATPMPPVPGIANVAQVAAGDGHTCVLRVDGTVYCWGANDFGQLGAGPTRALNPVEVPALRGSLRIALGRGHSCGLRGDGGAACVGDNSFGQLGAAIAMCPSGQTRCGGVCVDTQTDNQHCGSCGFACAAGQSCSSGVCGGTICTNGLTRCAGSCVDVRTDNAHCGTCGTACTGGRTCVGGVCLLTCGAGTGNCDGNAANGCETNLATSVAHCGRCNNACAFPRATAVCTAGMCAVGTCNSGFSNCDMNSANGCETDVGADPLNCGRCGSPCGSGQRCARGVCLTGCGGGEMLCGSVCVNLQTSNAHCGACNNPCAVGRTCMMGRCV